MHGSFQDEVAPKVLPYRASRQRTLRHRCAMTIAYAFAIDDETGARPVEPPGSLDTEARMPPLRSPAAPPRSPPPCSAPPISPAHSSFRSKRSQSPTATSSSFSRRPAVGLGGVSIALRDSLLDPFTNPAKASRLSEKSKGTFFGSPTSYSVSRGAGGGRTFPLGGIYRSGSNFGGVALAIQEIDKLDASNNPVAFAVDDVVGVDGTVLPQPATPSRQNRFAFGTVGHVFEGAGMSVGLSALASSLHDIDGVDLLYAGSRGVRQHGGEVDVRLGLLKEWSGGKSMEAMLLHDRFNMAQDVSWADQVWDPNARTFGLREQIDHNLDRTNTWGLHLGYSQPFADSGLARRRNRHDESGLTSQASGLPDLSSHDHSLGSGPLGGIRPRRRHRESERSDDLRRRRRVRADQDAHVGRDAVADRHRHANAAGREQDDGEPFRVLECNFATGLGVTSPFDTVHGSPRSIRVELGLALRSINYTLDQIDHVARDETPAGRALDRVDADVGIRAAVQRSRAALHGSHVDGQRSSGDRAGRPSRVRRRGSRRGTNILSAPSGSMSLTGVTVTTHQISVSVPIR